MKIFKKSCAVLILAVALVLTFTLAFADSDKSVYDRAGLFTTDEIASLEALASKLFAKTDCNIYIVTDDSQEYIIYNGDYRVPYWGDHFAEEYGITGNSIILIITANSNNNYDMYTYGEAYSKLSDSDVNSILDDSDVFDNIKSGRYFLGAEAFIKECADEYTVSAGEIAVVAVVLASITTLIFAICVYSSYNKKLRSEKYPLDRYASLKLTEQTDTFAGRFVTSRKVSHSNSGRSSGGGFSGGRGGGGGHRGGR